MPNAVLRDGPYPHYDVERSGASSSTAWPSSTANSRIDAISITTHGATAALLDAEGELALPVLDYEHRRPRRTRRGL